MIASHQIVNQLLERNIDDIVNILMQMEPDEVFLIASEIHQMGSTLTYNHSKKFRNALVMVRKKYLRSSKTFTIVAPSSEQKTLERIIEKNFSESDTHIHDSDNTLLIQGQGFSYKRSLDEDIKKLLS